MSAEDEGTKYIIPCGTVRFYIRTGMNGTTFHGESYPLTEAATSPLLGFAIEPLPEGVQAGDCIEVRLLPNGGATWKVVKKKSHQSIQYSQGRNADSEFVEGIVGRTCFPDCTAWEREKQRRARRHPLEVLGELNLPPWTYNPDED